MIERYVEAVSTYAGSLDSLVTLIAVIVGFWFILTEAVFFGFIFRYRKRDGQRADYITGEEKELKRWVTWPHLLVLVCDVFIIIGAVRVWYDVKQQLPEEPYATVRVIAQQWAWTFVHPGADRELDTPDDIETIDELHIEAGRVYHYHLESKDVLHDFSVPVFRLKQDAVPGRVITGWFEALPDKTGTYDIQCAEICGIGHGLMGARIVVESPEAHAAWIADNSVALAANTAAPGR
jgi:cytochrome c oxidase subunit 2